MVATSSCVYTGSFDPITLGHIDIIRRASKLCDKLIVAIGNNSQKTSMFGLHDRIQMAKLATQDISNVCVMSYDGLLTEFLKEQNVNLIVRGIRNTIDLEQEKILYSVYKGQMPEIEAIYLFASQDTQHISSTVVRDLNRHKADLNAYLPQEILELIYAKQKPD